jgi:hypothetical protein
MQMVRLIVLKDYDFQVMNLIICTEVALYVLNKCELYACHSCTSSHTAES